MNARQAIDAECPNKVVIANLISTYTAEDVFKFDQTCSLNDNKTAAHCTGSIEVLADKKPALSVYPSVSVTLVFTVTYDTAATQVGHTEPNAYTFTVPREGKADFEFDTAYDEKWGIVLQAVPRRVLPGRVNSYDWFPVPSPLSGGGTSCITTARSSATASSKEGQ